MKPVQYILLLTLYLPAITAAQPNCSIITDEQCKRACMIYNAADSFYQGTPESQYYLDSSIKLCPGFADAWREKSVPFLKRGDFVNWKKYIDKAVELNPFRFLSTRGWCRFKFLRDYEGALDDLKKNDTLTQFASYSSGDGGYELHVVMALCERELGNNGAALKYFAIGIDSVIARRGNSAAGLYSYVHLAVAKMRMKDYEGAMKALEKQNGIYDKYAETYYYMGCINTITGKKALAKENFLQAREFVISPKGKYRFFDIYCELHDAVYLSDIDARLSELE
jgi:tetratricopeptide (TPR) repeat protein